MKIKRFLLAGAACAAFSLALPVVGVQPLTSPAEAATNVGVSIGIGTFYDRLSTHGNWVSYHNDYVFVPAGIQVGWRPYTLGHWDYTRRYGWLWVSDEPFGWATYHYGRWGFAQDIGWYWVPGQRWAPAWVQWRRSDDYVAWAPLPVDYPDNDVSVNISVGNVPPFYWQAVEAPVFLSVNIGNYVIRDRNRTVRIIERSRPLGGVKIVNKTVVNNVIDVDFIQKKTRKKVVVRDVVEADSPDAAGKKKGDAVAVFAPEVEKKDKAAKPKQVTSVDEVKAKRKKSGADAEANAEATTDQQQTGIKTDTQTDVKTGDQQTDQAGKKKQADQKQGADQGQVDQANQPDTSKKTEQQASQPDTKKKKSDEEATKSDKTKQQANQPEKKKSGDGPANKKKKVDEQSTKVDNKAKKVEKQANQADNKNKADLKKKPAAASQTAQDNASKKAETAGDKKKKKVEETTTD